MSKGLRLSSSPYPQLIETGARCELTDVEIAPIEATVTTQIETYQQKLQQYEEAFASATQRKQPPGEATRAQLRQTWQTLGLSEVDVKAIEAPILAQIETYQTNLRRYEQAFADATEQQYPLSDAKRSELQQHQQALSLNDEDIASIENQITASIEEHLQKLQQYEQVFLDSVQFEFPVSEPTRAELRRFQHVLELSGEDVARVEEKVISQREDQAKLARLQRYEQEFTKAIEAGYPLDSFVRDGLTKFQQSLELSDEDVARLEAPLVAPQEAAYQEQLAEEQRRKEAAERQLELERQQKLEQQRQEQARVEYENRLRRYEEEFTKVITAQYPLDSYARDGLTKFQQSLELSDEDVARIEAPLVAPKEAAYQQRLADEQRRKAGAEQRRKEEAERQLELERQQKLEQQRQERLKQESAAKQRQAEEQERQRREAEQLKQKQAEAERLRQEELERQRVLDQQQREEVQKKQTAKSSKATSKHWWGQLFSENAALGRSRLVIGSVILLTIGGIGLEHSIFSSKTPQVQPSQPTQTLSEPIQTLSGSANSIAFSPDGQTLVSSSESIKIWNPRTGELIRTLNSTTGFGSIAINPNGQTLAAENGDKTISLWNLKTGQKIRTFAGHSNYIWSVAFSPDGKTLASSSSDSTVKLWNPDTGEEIRTLKGHYNSVTTIAFSPDGKILVSGSVDGRIKFWNTLTGEENRTITPEGSSTVNSVAISPDGKILASSAYIWGNSLISLWDMKTGKELPVPPTPPRGKHNKTGEGWEQVIISPNGKILAGRVSSQGITSIELWNLQTGEAIDTIKSTATNSTTSIAFSPDNRTIASGTLAILRTKFEQILRLKPLFCRGQDLFFQVRGRANFEKIARSLNHKL